MRRSAGAVIALMLIVALAACGSGDKKNGKFLERGKEYAQKKDYARAVLQFRNEAKLVPNSPEPYYQLGLAYLGMRNGRAAYAYFKKAVELDPNHTDAQIKLAELTALNPNKDLRNQAEERARGVLQRSPGNPDALTVLALTDIAAGDQKAGEEQLLDALQATPTHLKAAVTLAGLKMQAKDLAGAESVLRSITERDPKSADAAIALGRFYTIVNRPDGAVREFERAVKLQPRNGAALLSLAQLQIAIGKKADAEQTFRQLAALPDREYRTTHAMYLFGSNQRDAAIRELEDIFRKDPTDRSTRALLVHSYLIANRQPDAENILRSALKENPKDTEALLQRAALMLKAGRHSDAQNDLTQVLRFTPDSATAHAQMAKLHRARGAQLQARQELNEALRLDASQLDARLELAEDLMSNGNAKVALNVLDEAPEPQRQSLPVLTKRAKALIALQRFPEARVSINAGMKLGRTRDLLLIDSQLRLQQKDFQGARIAAEEILKAFPEDVAALENAAVSYFLQKQPEAALERVRNQVAIKPGSARLQYFLALQLIANRRTAEARDVLTNAIAADQSFFPAVLERARLDIREGRAVQARADLTQLVSSGTAGVPALLLLAQLDINESHSGAAIEHYRRVLNLDSNNVLALNNLASLLADQVDAADEALKHAQRLKELVPNDPTVDDTVGWAFYRKGLYSTAVQYLQTAASKKSPPAVKYHLAMAYFKAGDISKAQETLEAALRESSNIPEAAAARQLIAQR